MSLLSLAISLLGFVFVVIGWVLLLILRDAMSKEAAAVIPERTRSLIERAKNRLPEEARPRWEEEWPAGFAEAIEKRPVWALREAISLYRGAGKIAAELEPAAATARGNRKLSLSWSRPRRAPRGSRRLRLRDRWLLRVQPNIFGRVNRLEVLLFRSVNRVAEAISRALGYYAGSPEVQRVLGQTFGGRGGMVVLFFVGLALVLNVQFRWFGL